MNIKKIWTMFVLLVLAGIVGNQAFANPTGEQVTAGSATFDRSGNELNINTSDRAIIKWQDFSINQSEITKFVQPSTSSAVLNRVVGANASAINGMLQANGQVYLINPHGVVVGKDGVVNTGGFVASTLDISDDSFMSNSDMLFSGTSNEKVEIQGKVSALGGDVYLIAREVKNSGEIEVANGEVGIAAGTQVLLKASGDDRLLVQAASAAGAIENSGSIKAVTASLKAAGGNVYALAINNTGVIEATGVVKKDGRVILTSEGGNISHSGKIVAKSEGDKGGDVQLLGKNVTLSGSVDVSGKAAGGRVLAIAKDTATFSGSIDGQSVDGKGADVEVSGDKVSITGKANLLSQNGEAGEFLIDPGTININHSSTASSGPNTFSDSWIVDQLNLANLKIQTSSATGGGTEDILINSGVDITWSQPTKFELIAGRYIKMTSATIKSTAANKVGDSIVMNANEAGAGSGNFTGITIYKSVVESNSGDIVMKGRGGNSGANNHGIFIYGGSRIESKGVDPNATDAEIKLIGTGGNGSSGRNMGVFMSGSSILTQDGDISITGKGGSNYYYNMGVNTEAGSLISASGKGDVYIKGTGGSGYSYAIGVNNSQSKITTNNGDIAIIGYANGGNGSYNIGVINQLGSAIYTTGSGDVDIEGKGGSGYGYNFGVYNANWSAIVTTGGGSVFIKGQGGSGSAYNIGVYNYAGSLIGASCGGDVMIDATGGTGNSFQYGLYNSFGSVITSNDGGICIKGQGGSSGYYNHGIYNDYGSLIAATGKGHICMRGTGGSGSGYSYGVYNSSGSAIMSNNGRVCVQGKGGSGGYYNHGVYNYYGSLIGSYSGDVYVTGTGGSGRGYNYGIYNYCATIGSCTGATNINGVGGQGFYSNGLVNYGWIKNTGGWWMYYGWPYYYGYGYGWPYYAGWNGWYNGGWPVYYGWGWPAYGWGWPFAGWGLGYPYYAKLGWPGYGYGWGWPYSGYYGYGWPYGGYYGGYGWPYGGGYYGYYGYGWPYGGYYGYGYGWPYGGYYGYGYGWPYYAYYGGLNIGAL